MCHHTLHLLLHTVAMPHMHGSMHHNYFWFHFCYVLHHRQCTMHREYYLVHIKDRTYSGVHVNVLRPMSNTCTLYTILQETLARFLIWLFGEFGIDSQIKTFQLNLMQAHLWWQGFRLPKINFINTNGEPFCQV